MESVTSTKPFTTMIPISKYNKQHPLRIFEAFAGYGSQSLAFKYLKEKHPEFDFKVVGCSEIEPSAIQAYGLLHGREIPNFGDVNQGRQAHQQSAQSPLYPQNHGALVQRQSNHRNDARWFVVSTRHERNVGTINVPVRSHPRLILTFTL